jgi:hypothetical protein
LETVEPGELLVVGVPEADAAWLSAAKAALADPTGLVDANDLGTAAYEDASAFDAAGSAAVVAGDLTTHVGATGAGVHGAGATGAALLATATQDAARAALGLAAVAVPPIRIYHPHLTFTATDVIETGTGATTVNGLFDLRSGVTAGSRVRWRPASDSISATNFCTTFANWTRRVQFSGQIKFVLLPALMTNYYIFGKTPSAGFGKVAAGDYVGVTLIAESMTEGFVCKSGVVVSVPFTPVVRDGSTGLHFSIISENGTVQFYVNGALAGSTADGPINANASGTINIELDSGAASSIMQCVTQSEGW